MQRIHDACGIRTPCALPQPLPLFSSVQPRSNHPRSGSLTSPSLGTSSAAPAAHQPLTVVRSQQEARSSRSARTGAARDHETSAEPAPMHAGTSSATSQSSPPAYDRPNGAAATGGARTASGSRNNRPKSQPPPPPRASRSRAKAAQRTLSATNNGPGVRVSDGGPPGVSGAIQTPALSILEKKPLRNGVYEESVPGRAMMESTSVPLLMGRPVVPQRPKPAVRSDLMLQIRLGGILFTDSEDMFQYFSMVLRTSEIDTPLQSHVEKAVLDLLETGHRDPASKIGPGVRSIFVALRRSPHPNTSQDVLIRCFMLRRTDGQLADFSYRKCINRLLWGGWDNRLPRLLELRALAVQSRPSPEQAHTTARRWQNSSRKPSSSHQGDDAEGDPDESALLPPLRLPVGDLSGIGLGPAPVAEADRPYAPDVAEEILQIAENSTESLTLTGALAAVFSLAACVKVQPNLQQVIAEDPRLPLLEGLFTVEGLEKLARPNALYLVSLLWAYTRLQYVPWTGVLERLADILLVHVHAMPLREVASICNCYRWAQTRIIPPPALLHKIGTRFENALRWAVERADSDLVPLPGPDSATSREVVSLCSNYLQLSVVSDSLLEALELWLLRFASEMSAKEAASMLASLVSLGHNPGADLVNSLVACVARKSRGADSDVAERGVETATVRTLGALESLAHRPTDKQALVLCSHLDKHVRHIRERDVDEVLHALAVLGITPVSDAHGQGFVGALMEGARARLMDDASPYCRLRVVWSVAVLQKTHEVPWLGQLLESACADVDPHQTTPRFGSQLMHTVMLLQHEDPAMLAGMHIPRVVADWAECTWLYDALMCVTTSPTQRTIARQLRELGLNVQMEYVTEGGLFSIDIVLLPPVQRRNLPLPEGTSVESDSSPRAPARQQAGQGRPPLSTFLLLSEECSLKGQNRWQPQREGQRQADHPVVSPQLQALIAMVGSHPLPQLDEQHFNNLEVDDFSLRREELDDDEQEEGAITGPVWLNMGDENDAEGGLETEADDDVASAEEGGAERGLWDGRCNGRAVHVEGVLAAAGLPRIAIEVDGPHHFASNCDYPLGRTTVRNRLLGARDWHVVSISDCRWLHLPQRRKMLALELMLREAGVPLDLFLPS